jgi:copper(I)-binding protein
MHRLDAIPVAPGAPARLEPGGQHIMLMGLSAPLADGDTLELTLTFERAGEITLDVPVSKRPAQH